MTDSTQRFADRVDNYVKYRPGYPSEIITTLKTECQLTSAAMIADIGSGTGILSELFLQNGNQVYAVEPNPEMRAAGERLLSRYPGFHSVPGRAEATALADQSVDFVVAGQAFHWFDRPRARTEFNRILKPGGWLMLVWNSRVINATPFLIAYEQLLQRHGTDYVQVNHAEIKESELAQFYGPAGLHIRKFSNVQQFDFAGVKGRLLSSSYAPAAGHPDHVPMVAELRRIFDTHQENDAIQFLYTTEMYYGQLLV